MNENEHITGVVRVWNINERGYVMESQEYSGVITREGSALVRKMEGGSSAWCILVGTEDRIRYRGKNEPGRVRVLDQEYPNVVEDDGGKRVIICRATFVVDDLNARGVNAAVLVNRPQERLRLQERPQERAQNIAYARIAPTLRIRAGGMLQVQWEMTVRSEVLTMSREQLTISN
jgi:hypothetical protein